MGNKPLAYPSDIVFVYDGTLVGFYNCVFESVYSRKIPCVIYTEDTREMSLMSEINIISDEEKADRVRASLKNLSLRAFELVEKVFLSNLKEKEIKLLHFLLFAYKEGGKVTKMLGHELVNPLLKAERLLLHEAHLFTGFARFSDYDGVLVATISPKNFVLPFFAKHFVGRYSQEEFLIFDDVHKAALVYRNKKVEIIPIDKLELKEITEKEKKYQELWKRFYNTIAIEERENPRCRMTHMPKRYWKNMTEMREFL